MELLDYRKELIETVKAMAAADGDFEIASFVNYTSQRLIESEEFDDFEPAYWEGVGKRNRRLAINGYSFNDVDDSLNVVIADYTGKEEPHTLTLTEAERLFQRVKGFLEESLEGRLHPVLEESMPAYSLASQLYTEQSELRRIKIYIISDGILSSRVKDLQNDSLGHIILEFHVWDIARFHRVFQSASGRDDLVINFNELGFDGMPCLQASEDNGEYHAYLCVIPGNLLASIYDRYGSRLLEGNVRAFLSTKGKVNKGIRETILTKPWMFFAYNNGIAATATDIKVESTPMGLRIVECADLQIVNGGQTTASVLMAKLKDKSNLDQIFVPMKLSVINAELSQKIIPDISRYANSQNKVSDADFFSNHPFHVRFEDMSRRIWAPAVNGAQHETHWFYVRANGQYLNEQIKMTPTEKARFLLQNPRNQVVSKTDLAKYQYSWMEFPHVVAMGAQKNFKQFAEFISKLWDEANEEINEEFYRTSIALTILFRHTEKLVSKQPWYDGFRAQIVEYTIAKLAYLVRTQCKGRSLDTRRIWNQQALSEALEEQLMIIAEKACELITKPEAGYGNPGEWSKKEQCWKKFIEVSVELSKEFTDELIDVNEVKASKRESRGLQKVDNGINAQIEVVQLGAEYWEALLNWAKTHDLMSGDEESLIRIATRISHGVIPSDKQSNKLLTLKARMVSEGYAG